MAPIDVLPCDDVVLEVDPTGGTFEAVRTAARNDRVLAASSDLQEPVETSGSHLDVNLYVVANVPSGPPSRLPTNTSSPRSWYTPLGIPLSVALITFVYQQPSRLPVNQSGSVMGDGIQPRQASAREGSRVCPHSSLCLPHSVLSGVPLRTRELYRR